ncbi:MAG TPA: [FeFe] hydrogenase H-cluster maturation GTPase HydF [Candidatus Hydrogenedentes bacterium]|nr:MAG: GTPase Era [Candidatus Hydrogenedentes bacterium ADurb.Bin170]HNZ47990.1 [FeFe] hydrogenase H-cluster maturation GTPase HydF [Candidatus Hydrogenedentota bacterium]HOD94276.1 [FeFe] hydrogenase H-cluster maturation GTPase HydF [Candidatus Hydrogenedentota bacterium]HOM48121.1 [FeFe] hydrogenase H-cluster maturation GTPase HydF [Candidatus Hydrogenedentota bacterium]HPK23686.1 [FeFe] hydrogenase H-cluster maturation GTPase HydF [Candidatus Hydrogenedentota bacterium]
MRSTPKSMRLHIGLFGRRNAGKSSLLNAVTAQQVSIVSPVAGTTTDPVEKAMELLPLGPVLFIDTAGLDDEGTLGELRKERTRAVFERVDLGVIVCQEGEWGAYEEMLFSELDQRKVPVIAVFNKSDIKRPDTALLNMLSARKIASLCLSTITGEGLGDFRQALLDSAPADFVEQPVILRDLVGAGELAVLVTPIDKEAPKGRLIMPQVQSIRDLLDGDASCLVTTDKGLAATLAKLKEPPKLVVTDSQAFLKVAADTPSHIPMTGFSILFSRYRGDLVTQVEGALAIDSLKPGDRVLIAESCSHHPIEDDIGRVKIPQWLMKYVQGELIFDSVQGHDFKMDLSPYKLVIHCGACVTNRRAMLNRLLRCRKAGIPVTNYGLTIAYSLGIFERALEPFPDALAAYEKHKLYLKAKNTEA